MQKKSIWLLSAYRSESHAAWADWLVNSFSEFNWHCLELPGRHFRWRIRGNPLSWLDQLPTETPELIIATSMVDLATLKGLHPRIARTKCIYYFHENQFAYPVSESQHASIDPQMVQLYAAIAADELLFNSAFNRDSFLDGVAALLKKLPDEIPSGLVERLSPKCQILPVPVKPIPEKPIQVQQHTSPQLILWNHRWEYDKAPQIFYEALKRLKQKAVPFELALLGDRAAQTPEILHTIANEFASQIRVNEKVSRSEYENWLAKSRCVVSTARHEFQGLSIMEAVSAGAVPVVPNDVCYPEQYADDFLYEAGNAQALADKIAFVLTQTTTAPDISPWTEDTLKPAWLSVLSSDQGDNSN